MFLPSQHLCICPFLSAIKAAWLIPPPLPSNVADVELVPSCIILTPIPIYSSHCSQSTRGGPSSPNDLKSSTTSRSSQDLDSSPTQSGAPGLAQTQTRLTLSSLWALEELFLLLGTLPFPSLLYIVFTEPASPEALAAGVDATSLGRPDKGLGLLCLCSYQTSH